MKTFLVLYAGGINDFANYSRYPADLQAVLTAAQGLPGLSPTSINILAGPGGASFSFGETSINALVADRATLEAVLREVSSSATGADRFLFVSSNHGGQVIKDQKSSTLYTWGGRTIVPNEFADWISKMSCEIQVYVLGQCYSGGFIEALSGPKKLVMTACDWDEVSYASTVMAAQYDEFVYNFANGLNARIPTWERLFAYAKINDKEKESPQYSDLGNIGGRPIWQ